MNVAAEADLEAAEQRVDLILFRALIGLGIAAAGLLVFIITSWALENFR